MIFDENNQPVEQTGTGLNKPDGWSGIGAGGDAVAVYCQYCGAFYGLKANDIQSSHPKERRCPHCHNIVGTW